RVVAEHHRGRLELAVPLDVDLARGVDEDVRDIRVAKQRLDGSEAVDLVQDLVAQVLAVAVAERDRKLAKELRDRGPQLALRLIQIHLGEVGEVHPVEQETVDAELQVLVRAIGRVGPGRRAGPCRRRGLGVGNGSERLLVESDPIFQLHGRVSLVNMRWSRCPRLAFVVAPRPASLSASSPMAVASPASRGAASVVPAFIAPPAPWSSRGRTWKTSLPIARAASASDTRPGTAWATTRPTRPPGRLRRSSSSTMRRAARTPGTERSVSARIRSLCSNAASEGPLIVRAVSTTMNRNCTRRSRSATSTSL